VQKLNWSSYLPALSIVGIEVGFLLAHRSGWNLGIAAVFTNVVASLILVPVVSLVFKDKLNWVNDAGTLVCPVGLMMLNRRRYDVKLKRTLFIFLFTLFVTSCASSTPAPIVTTADAVATVEKFYKIINNAQTEDDLLASWVLMTSKGQCSDPKNFCTHSYFQENWWRWNVVYELYGCSPTRVAVREALIPRDGNAASASPAPRYWEYELVETESGIMINDKYFIQAPGDDCELMVDSSKG